MGGIGPIAGLAADTFEQHRVGLGIGFSLGMRVRERLFVVRIVDEALHESIDLGPIHA